MSRARNTETGWWGAIAVSALLLAALPATAWAAGDGRGADAASKLPPQKPRAARLAGLVQLRRPDVPAGHLLVARAAPAPLPAQPAELAWMFLVELPPARPPDLAISAPAGSPRWADLAAAQRWDGRYGPLVLVGEIRQMGVGLGIEESPSRSRAEGRVVGFRGGGQLSWSTRGGKGGAPGVQGPGEIDRFFVVRPDGMLVAPGQVKLTLAYRQPLSGDDRLAVIAVYDLTHLFDLAAAGDATLEQAQYAGGVLQCRLGERLLTAVHYLYGAREGRAGAPTTDNRLQISTGLVF